jgi:hypothetical protein
MQMPPEKVGETLMDRFLTINGNGLTDLGLMLGHLEDRLYRNTGGPAITTDGPLPRDPGPAMLENELFAQVDKLRMYLDRMRVFNATLEKVL